MVIPTTFPFGMPIWPVPKTDGSWRITVDYHQLNQVMILAAAAIPDMVSLLHTFSGTWYAAIELANAFFHLSINETHQSSLFSAGKASNTS